MSALIKIKTEDANEMWARAKKAFIEDGRSMSDIAKEMSRSREFVRQQFKKRFNLDGSDGKTRKTVAATREEKRQAPLKKFFDFYGMSKIEMDAILAERGTKVKVAYMNQRANAKRSKIEWNLTFADWWRVWEKSKLFDQRGQGKMGLLRINTALPFEIGNVRVGDPAEAASVKMKQWWGENREQFSLRRSSKPEPVNG